MSGYLMAAPFILLFIIFIVVPVVWSLILSLTHYNIVQPMTWAGLDNYKDLFTNDDLFITACKNTFTYAIIVGPAGFLLSFLFAWLINQLKFRNAFAMAFYAPSLTGAVSMSVIWLVLFSSDRYGYINDKLISLGLISEPILWNTDPTYIMPVIIIIALWSSMGQGFLTNLAGLNNIPQDRYEAAQIDGIRNKFQELIYITLPSVKPQLLFNAVMGVVGALGVFDLATGIAGFPSPDYAAHTIVAHMYDYAFLRFELGYASAIAFILFILNFGLGRIFMKVFSSKGE
ncbi:MAG: sugar ABC transporter permease [Clostridiales bacterium]|nr:sugar ABC transporter permease [Clostridiales bacterium]